MEIIEKGDSIRIHAGVKCPFRKIIVDASLVVILVWGVFGVLVAYLSHPAGQILPYFLGITLLLLIPLVAGILMRYARHYDEILIDGAKGVINAEGFGRQRQVSFDEIKEFRVNQYRFRKDQTLFRLEAVIASGKPLRLLQDVPDDRSLSLLAKKLHTLKNSSVAALESGRDVAF